VLTNGQGVLTNGQGVLTNGQLMLLNYILEMNDTDLYIWKHFY
jgi:hypothetical protein